MEKRATKKLEAAEQIEREVMEECRKIKTRIEKVRQKIES